jgi:hypothetical protein
MAAASTSTNFQILIKFTETIFPETTSIAVLDWVIIVIIMIFTKII